MLRTSLLANRSHPNQRNSFPIFYRLLPTPLHRKSGKGYFFGLGAALRPLKSSVSVSIIFERLPLRCFRPRVERGALPYTARVVIPDVRSHYTNTSHRHARIRSRSMLGVCVV